MRDEIEIILEGKYPEYKLLPKIDDNLEDNPREDFWDNLTELETYDVNAEYLKISGNPKYDYLTCWEPGRIDDEKETLFDYPTFYAFDKAWWQYQKEAEYEHIEECKKWMESGSEHWTPEKVAKSINQLEDRYKDGYSMYCTGDWFRLIENDTFLYAQIISAKWYIYFELETVISELQEKLLPYTFNEKDYDIAAIINLDDPEKKYLADGREKELDTLQTLIRNYESNELLALIERRMNNCNMTGCTFRYDRGYDRSGVTGKFDPFTDFIFWDTESLKLVKPTNFLDDFTSIQVTNNLLTAFIENATKEVESDFMVFYNKNKLKYN